MFVKIESAKAAMLSVLFAAVAFYVVLVVGMAVFQRSFLYYPKTEAPNREASGVGDMAEIHIETEDGLRLVAWTQPPAVAGKPWVVILHGNAGTIAGRAFKAQVFLAAGYGVMLVEYRGYGGNPGSPSEAGLFMDARAALQSLKAQGFSGRNLVLYGESLGTGVAVAMAFEAAQAGEPVGAVILEAPFTSIADVAQRHYPFLPARKLARDRYDSQSRIRGIQAPLYVVHGALDGTVPQDLGRELFKSALEPKDALWLDGAGHNDLFDFGLGEGALAFLHKHGL